MTTPQDAPPAAAKPQRERKPQEYYEEIKAGSPRSATCASPTGPRAPRSSIAS